MLHHKSCHKCGLDSKIYNVLKGKKLSGDYYLYIHDYCHSRKERGEDFYNDKNNEYNTWNLNLNFISTEKDNIMKISSKYGFPNYEYNEEDEKILVKAKNHYYSSLKNGQSHIVERREFEERYDKSKYIGQKILETNDRYNEELNIYVVRDLRTRELKYECVMVRNDKSYNINRKQSKCEYLKADINLLNKKEKENFKNYMDEIQLDYGRVELLKDRNLGWCIIDINNSPGGGPLTNYFYKPLSDIFKKIMQ